MHTGIIHNSYVTGTVSASASITSSCGGLVGTTQSSSIHNSYAAVTVSSSSSYSKSLPIHPPSAQSGGLVGLMFDSNIHNSYTTSTVSATATALANSISGGLVGTMYRGNINNSYAAGEATANSSSGSAFIGGLIGQNEGSNIIASYAKERDDHSGVKQESADFLRDELDEGAMGWLNSIWGQLGVNGSYPCLLGVTPGCGDSIFYRIFYGGDGSVGNPYLIGDYEGLKNIKNSLDAHYKLNADIDASPSQGENRGRGFLPIGDKSSAFRGSFDGDGHRIRKLIIRRPNTTYVGLFGDVLNGTAKNTGLEDVNILGNEHVGGLVGYMHGSNIHNSYVTGTASATTTGFLAPNSGGLVGYMHGSNIHNSYAEANVFAFATNSSSVSGGLVGGLSGILGADSHINNSYAGGSVFSQTSDPGSAGAFAGGLVGFMGSSHIHNSYATATTSSSSSTTYKSYSGGLVGEMSVSCTIQNSYAKERDRKASVKYKPGDYLQDELDEESTLGWDDSIWGRLGASGSYPCLLRITPICL